MASTWLYLVRHGEVEQASDGRFFGHTDVALAAAGRIQVEALARHLAPERIDAVYASDLRRARDSAAPLAQTRGLTPVLVPALREMAMGRWEGLTFREIREREPETVAAWFANLATFPFPGGLPLDHLLRLAQDYAGWSVIEYRPDVAILHTLNQRVAGIAAAAPVERTAVG